MAPNAHIVALARAISRLFGWIYTLSWSASFYPQPILNWQRKSTLGFAIDFSIANVLGFVCYTISTTCFLFSPLIREQYAVRHPASPEPTVRLNDAVFAIHAVFLTVLTLSQFIPSLWGFQVSATQKMSRPVAGLVCGSLLGIAITIMIVLVKMNHGNHSAMGWAWIDVIYAISYVKLIVTCVKYMPQVRVNYKRKSTVGWSIWQILFDLTGGILSMLQLMIDSSLQADWSGLTGNPVKLGLANVSIFFDIIFITQHYVLYRDKDKGKSRAEPSGADEPLLGDR